MQDPSIKAFGNEVAVSGFDLLFESIQEIPGAIHYSIKRYIRPAHWSNDDLAVIRYEQGEKRSLQLHFCLSGNTYCQKYGQSCDQCKSRITPNCKEQIGSIDIVSFTFNHTYLAPFASAGDKGSFAEKLFSFTHPNSFSKNINICSKTRLALDGLLNHGYTGSFENIYINAQVQLLLLHSLNCVSGEKEIDTISCRFLANEADRDKIIKAREILVQQIGEPVTIRELSKKVAINECYLKKGFKEMFGTTIFDFYQGQRMEHAKFLLYEKGLSVTDVSDLLGYSSISHFSTAFKRHTGLKPCELLLR